MKIGDVEKQTGISRKNIRFYEEQALLCPARGEDNRYRVYTQADVESLLQIKLLRKLGFGIAEIRALQAGELKWAEALAQRRRQVQAQQEELQAIQELCALLPAEAATLKELEADGWLRRMEQREKEGVHFVDIAKDFLTKLSRVLQPSWDIQITPVLEVSRWDEVERELVNWAARQQRDLSIIEPGPSGAVLVDGVRYRLKLPLPGGLSGVGYAVIHLYRE